MDNNRNILSQPQGVMFWLRNIKITAKLVISAAAFLLPLGIMLFYIISISVAGIERHKRELKGIEVIRPAITLMRIVPQYVRFTVDGASGDEQFYRQHITDSLNDLINKYTEHFGEEAFLVSPGSLRENWDHLANTAIHNTVIWSYRQLIQDLNRLIVYTGDISGLITDSEIESAYLIAATIYEAPQAQERMVIMGNLLRLIEGGAFTQRQRADFFRHLELLVHSDNARIQNRFNAAEALRIRQTKNFESFESLLKEVFNRISYFTNTVSEAMSESSINLQSLPALYEAANQANNAIFMLQTASLDRLETLIKGRINLYRLRLTISLIVVSISILTAFLIIFLTINNIRKSTITMDKIFKRLNENDLSVKIETASYDELGNFILSMNDFLNKLKNAFMSFNKNASMVSTAVMELSSSSIEITATANEQSASIAEIVTTMENNKELSAQAAERTLEVANLAAHTQELSIYGAELRDANEDMMLDIRNQNSKIIEIIRNLADMLYRIDESIQLIDSIADHTKLIAFNAALEASSSGETGSRFSVVAGEIRRFADNVVESAAEIKEKIMELQEASQSLITEANNGTRAIDEGYNRMIKQKEIFENIVAVSENVAVNTQQISNLSKKQELASAQVFLTLKEISLGVKQFVSATAMTRETTEKLNIMSEELKSTLQKYHTGKGREA